MRVVRDFSADGEPVVKAGDRVIVGSDQFSSATRSPIAGGQMHRMARVRTDDERDVLLPANLLFPASNRLEEHLGYRQCSVGEAHLQLLNDATPGCYLVVKKSVAGESATYETPGSLASAEQNYHLAILDHNGEFHVVRSYDVSYQMGAYCCTEKNVFAPDFLVSTSSMFCSEIE